MKYLFKYPFETLQGGELVFLSRIPGEVILILLLLASVGAWWMYRRVASRLAVKSRRLLLGLRLALLVLVFFMLGIPAVRKSKPRDAVFTAVLVDTSRSMAIKDVETANSRSAVSRMDATRQILVGTDNKGILGTLEKQSKVLIYSFAGDLHRVADPDQITAAGHTTNLFKPLRELEAELRGMPLAAVVLLTDGCRNEGGTTEDAARVLKQRRIPLHIVGVGNPTPPKDYEVLRVFAPRRVRRNTQVEIYVSLRYTDFGGKPFEVQINRGQTTLLSRQVTPERSTDLMRVRLTFTPDIEGSAAYTVAIPAAEGESVTDNNSREFVLEIRDDRLPVLYVEGSPRLEYRFLRRALFRDKEFRLVGVLRLSKDRFYVQGANAAEEFLSSGFPTTAEQLFKFQAVILGDIEASYFTPAQLELLEEFVKRRGGGLLMLGGVNSFGLGQYSQTAIAKLLPVEISDRDPAYSDLEYAAKTTEAGLTHPVMRLSDDPEVNRRLWEKVPPLKGITPVKGMKLGARTLLVQEGTKKPVLAVQKYGSGRVAAFTSGGSWYWQVSMPASNEFHEKFWKQLVRWLAAGAKQEITVESDADVYARGEKVTLRSMVRTRNLTPVNDANVIAEITDPIGNTETVPMNWILSQEGVYQCTYLSSEEGDYRVRVRVEGWDAEPAETDFKVSEPYVEFSNAGQKEAQLRQMAEIAAGRYYSVAEAVEIPKAVFKNIETASTAGIKPVDYEIWDMPVIYLALLVLLGSEWLIRRRNGLA